MATTGKAWQPMTYHFIDHGFRKFTIYCVLSQFECTGSIERKRRSGRKSLIMVQRKKRLLGEQRITKLAFLSNNESLQCGSAVASHIFVEL